MKQVGKIYDGKIFKYDHCESDINGWIKISHALPSCYDLLEIKKDNGMIKNGWYTGHHFEGAKIKEDDKLVYWRRKKDIIP